MVGAARRTYTGADNGYHDSHVILLPTTVLKLVPLDDGEWANLWDVHSFPHPNLVRVWAMAEVGDGMGLATMERLNTKAPVSNEAVKAAIVAAQTHVEGLGWHKHAFEGDHRLLSAGLHNIGTRADGTVVLYDFDMDIAWRAQLPSREYYRFCEDAHPLEGLVP